MQFWMCWTLLYPRLCILLLKGIHNIITKKIRLVSLAVLKYFTFRILILFFPITGFRIIYSPSYFQDSQRNKIKGFRSDDNYLGYWRIKFISEEIIFFFFCKYSKKPYKNRTLIFLNAALKHKRNWGVPLQGLFSFDT